MKKWTGGTLILVLSFILVVRYTYTYFGSQPPKQIKQSAYDFFRNHPSNNSQTPEIGSIATPSWINGTEVEKIKEKPRLIDVEGLDELYSSVNVLKEDMKSFATWPQLHIVLLRSDGLPETVKGVTEASVAWRELLSVIEREKSSKVAGDGGNGNNINEIKCPFSVSTFDEPVNSSRRLLELPCGLIEDSSITLIGIPNGQNRSFQIELEGAKFQHEKKPPIILHYNVYLPEENSTKNSVIVQNAWTNEVGWGREERCPGGRSTNYFQSEFYVLSHNLWKYKLY